MEQNKENSENPNGILNDEFPFDLTPHEDIQAAVQAIAVIEELDLVLLDEQSANKVIEIKKMALDITYQAIMEIYQANKYGTQYY